MAAESFRLPHRRLAPLEKRPSTVPPDVTQRFASMEVGGTFRVIKQENNSFLPSIDHRVRRQGSILTPDRDVKDHVKEAFRRSAKKVTFADEYLLGGKPVSLEKHFHYPTVAGLNHVLSDYSEDEIRRERKITGPSQSGHWMVDPSSFQNPQVFMSATLESIHAKLHRERGALSRMKPDTRDIEIADHLREFFLLEYDHTLSMTELRWYLNDIIQYFSRQVLKDLDRAGFHLHNDQLDYDEIREKAEVVIGSIEPPEIPPIVVAQVDPMERMSEILSTAADYVEDSTKTYVDFENIFCDLIDIGIRLKSLEEYRMYQSILNEMLPSLQSDYRSDFLFLIDSYYNPSQSNPDAKRGTSALSKVIKHPSEGELLVVMLKKAISILSERPRVMFRTQANARSRLNTLIRAYNASSSETTNFRAFMQMYQVSTDESCSKHRKGMLIMDCYAMQTKATQRCFQRAIWKSYGSPVLKNRKDAEVQFGREMLTKNPLSPRVVDARNQLSLKTLQTTQSITRDPSYREANLGPVRSASGFTTF